MLPTKLGQLEMAILKGTEQICIRNLLLVPNDSKKESSVVKRGTRNFSVRWAVHAFIGSLNTTTATTTDMVTRTPKKKKTQQVSLRNNNNFARVSHSLVHFLVFSTRLGRDIKKMLESLTTATTMRTSKKQ